MSQMKVIGNASLVFGTIELAGTVFGQVESGSIELTGDEDSVADNMAAIQAYLLTNDQYKVNLTAIVPSSASLPERGSLVNVPAINLGCSCLSSKWVYEKGKSKKLELTAAHWVSIGGALNVGPTVTVITDGVAAGGSAQPGASED